MRGLAQAWDRFWFPATDARALALMRAGLGLLMALQHLLLWPELALLLGPDGPVPLEAVLRGASPYRFSLYDHATSLPRLHAIHALGLLPMIALTVGWRTRASAILSLLVLASVLHRDRYMLDGGDRLLRVMAFTLAVAPLGLALSVDAWRARRRGVALPGTAPGTLRRLVQLQLMWMYFDAGRDKLQGVEWRQGTALFYTLSDRGLHALPRLVELLVGTAAGQALCRLGTWVSMGWELGFCLLVLWRPTRRLALALGVVFHLSIAGLMGIDTFGFAALWGYLAFVDPDWLGARVGALGDRLRGRPAAPPAAPLPAASG
jgi:hypothetical protein